jgi:hypothetical protein
MKTDAAGKPLKIGPGENCPKCKRRMQRRTHPDGWKPKKEQAYYFRWWDVCWNKKHGLHVQHYERAKVIVEHDNLLKSLENTVV